MKIAQYVATCVMCVRDIEEGTWHWISKSSKCFGVIPKVNSRTNWNCVIFSKETPEGFSCSIPKRQCGSLKFERFYWTNPY